MTRVERVNAPDFGRRISERMLKKNWNQSDLARAAGLGRDSISTYVRGMVLPDARNLKKLADALDCSPDDLMPSAERMPQDTIFEIRQTTDGKILIKINKAVTLDQAAAIFEILRDEK